MSVLEQQGQARPRLRQERVRKGLTREELARRTGLHANTIKGLENGTTRVVEPETARVLTKVLKKSAEDLDLNVRPETPPSIRLRDLSPEKRAVLQEILDLPEEQYEALRLALDRIRRKGKKT